MGNKQAKNGQSMNIKKAVFRTLVVLVVLVIYSASLLGAYLHGKTSHTVSPERFIEIASTHNSSGMSHMIGHDGQRAYVVFHKGMLWTGDFVYSTELAALPSHVRAEIAAGVVLK